MKKGICLLVIALSVGMLVISIFIMTYSREKPPMHVISDMDFQPRLSAQSSSDFFSDRRGMRLPPENTVAYGFLKEDDAFYLGYTGDSDAPEKNWVKTIPAKVDRVLLDRGRNRYDVYCAVCHGRAGNGESIVSLHLRPPPSDLHQDFIREHPDGKMFDIVSNGIRTMKGYKAQITEADRWAIVAYVRALQKSQNAQAGSWR